MLPRPSRWRPVRPSHTVGRQAGRRWSACPSERRSFSPARRTQCPNPPTQTSSNSPADGATARCSRIPARSALRRISATAHVTCYHYLRANCAEPWTSVLTPPYRGPWLNQVDVVFSLYACLPVEKTTERILIRN